MNTTLLLISEEEVHRVHGNANFGPIAPRTILNRGVLSAMLGYHVGSTLSRILRKHKLIRQNGDLTAFGKKYARALWEEKGYNIR